MTDEDAAPTRLTQSLSARLRRKEQVARGEAVPDMPDDMLPDEGGDQQAEQDAEAALSDEELLAKYNVEDPEEIEDEDKLDNLLQGQFPDRIRQMALRRMWRLNPLFRFADEMVEYGENYTDAATVIDGMQTAYQVGKGYLQKAFDAVEDEGGDAGDAKALSDTTQPADRVADIRDASKTEPEGTAASDNKQEAEAQGDAGPQDGAAHGSVDDVADDVADDVGGGAEDSAPAVNPEARDAAESPESDEPAPPRARRMTFVKPTGPTGPTGPGGNPA